MLKASNKITVHIFGTDGKEIKTLDSNTAYTVCEKNGKLGINYNTERKQTTSDGDVFVPFESFSYTVVFENVENGKKYYWSNAENAIVEKEV